MTPRRLLALLLLAVLPTPALSVCTVDPPATTPVPPFPTSTYSGTVPTALTTHHASASVTLPRATIPPTGADSSQTDCPHEQSNLVNWHDPSIWPGDAVPVANSNVTLPANSQVLVSSCSIVSNTVFQYVTIPATSALIFTDAAQTFAAWGITVNGAMYAGSPTCRLRNKVTIILYGPSSSYLYPANAFLLAAPNPPYAKGIWVSGEGATLNLCGAQFLPTWTRLAATAHAGDTTVFVQDVVNWQAGQQMVVLGTQLKSARDYTEDEVLTIATVQLTANSAATSVSAITLTTPLQFSHYAGVEYQAEVALLSRNVLVEGDASSEPTDSSTTYYNASSSTSSIPASFRTGFGGHVLIDGSGAVGALYGVELYRMGQTNRNNRHPVNFHLLGDLTLAPATTPLSNGVVSECSVHHSFNRAISVTGVNGTQLVSNTAWDITGNALVLAAGTEESNTVSYNLVALVHMVYTSENPGNGHGFLSGIDVVAYRPDYFNSNPLVSDISMAFAPDAFASCYLLSNAQNSLVGNAAAGCWFGYWYPALPLPLAPFASENTTSPMHRPLLTFNGNTAHSTSYWWYLGGAGAHFGGVITTASSGAVALTSTPIPRDPCSVEPLLWGGACPSWARQPTSLANLKVFLSNGVALRHGGAGGAGAAVAVSGLETHDLSGGYPWFVVGPLSIQDALVECRSGNPLITYFQGCPGLYGEGQFGASTPPPTTQGTNQFSDTYGCQNWDYYFWYPGVYSAGAGSWWGKFGLAFPGYGQSTILSSVNVSNCDWPSLAPTGCLYGCVGSAFAVNTESDLYAVGPNFSVRNTSLDNFPVNGLFSLDQPSPVTTAGRFVHLLDTDGVLTGWGSDVSVLVGSALAGAWWNVYPGQCILSRGGAFYECPLSPGDTVASVSFRNASVNSTDIDVTRCMASGGGTLPCYQIGAATGFGRLENTTAVDVSLNALVTGALIAEQGGWFVRFEEQPGLTGTPATLTITNIQAQPTASLLLAFPYPPGSSFTVTGHASPATCNATYRECTHPFPSASRLVDIRVGQSPGYYVDGQTLFVRLVMINDTDFGPLGASWPYGPAFSVANLQQGALTLPLANNYSVVIAAECARSTVNESYCAPAPEVGVPPALGLIPDCLSVPDWSLSCVADFPGQTATIVELLVGCIVMGALWRHTYVVLPWKWVVEDARAAFRKRATHDSVRGVPASRWACAVLGGLLVPATTNAAAVQVVAAFTLVALVVAVLRRDRKEVRPLEYVAAGVTMGAVAGLWAVFALTPFNGLGLVVLVALAPAFALCDAYEAAPDSVCARLEERWPRAFVETSSIDAFVMVEVASYSADKSEKTTTLALAVDVEALKPGEDRVSRARDFAVHVLRGFVALFLGLYFSLVILSQ